MGNTWNQPMSVTRGMDRRNVAHTCNGVLFNYEKKGDSVISDNMNKPVILNEISQTQGDK
jgi:hypothetical protein